MAKKEEIILGSGDLYYTEFDGATVPEDSTLEVEEKRAGHSFVCRLGKSRRKYRNRIQWYEKSYFKLGGGGERRFCGVPERT